MNQNMTNEREIATDWSNGRERRLRGRFLKGPIPFPQLSAAAKLPGQALSVYLATHHQTSVTGREWVVLPRSLMDQLGVSRDAKARALQQLESASLVQVIRSEGRTARVRLQPLDNVESVSANFDQIIWQNKDWRVTKQGLSSVDPSYHIGVDQLADTRALADGTVVSMWPMHMAEKSWVNLKTFVEAFEIALTVHCPASIPMLHLDVSLAAVHQSKQGLLVHSPSLRSGEPPVDRLLELIQSS